MSIMLKFVRISTPYMMFGVKHPKVGAVLSSCFYSTVEFPVLPHWFKNQGSESEDDFVLPTSNHACTVDDRRDIVSTRGQEVVGVDLDVNRICKLLKGKFTSPEAVVTTLGSCSVQISEDLVDRILKRFGNEWVSAFGFFMWADARIGYKHSADSYNMMVDILGKMKQFDLMWGLLEEMNRIGGLMSLATMTKVMRRLSGAGRWGDAIRVFQDLEHYGVTRDTVSMNVLLDTLCKEKSVKHARDVFHELRIEIPPNAASFNALVHGWCKARKLDEAWKTLEEMREFNFTPCAITYTSLIEAYCAEKNFGMVNDILDKMRAQGHPPNIVTYTIVMHALGKAMETQKALEVFDMMKRDGCVPDTLFYNSLIYILSRAGHVQEANDIYEEMGKSGSSPNVTTYNTLISAACHRSQEDIALMLLLKMEDSSCRPNIETYAPLLKLCCRKKLIRILLYLLAHMFKKDISPDLGTYALLVRGLCHNGELEHACLFFEEMVMKGLIPKKDTYRILVEALEWKDMDKAKSKVLQLMMLAQNMK